MAKLIAFYSRGGENSFSGTPHYDPMGNTEKVANAIAVTTRASLLRIEQREPYAADFKTCLEQAIADWQANARPKLVRMPSKLDEYDEIYLGYPNFCGDMPMAVYTFLEKYDWHGKTIHPFCTHEGSGMSGPERKIQDVCKGARVTSGLPIHSSELDRAFVLVEKWIHGFTNMAVTESARNYRDQMFPGESSYFLETDPEFMERFDNFAFDEVVNYDDLDGKTRFMAILAALLGCQGIDEFQIMVPAAMNFGVKPVEIKEIVYQAVAYLGIGRVYPFLKVTNEVLKKKGVELPLTLQATTTMENRRESGIQAQVDIFGEEMRHFWNSGPVESRHINRWLAENCFGDYYTRTGLDYKQREMITFCFLAAQGGCEPQLISHAAANMRLGNDKEFLIAIISQCLPYIGYPRSLNALRCVKEAEANQK